jgi:hypothetical protein
MPANRTATIVEPLPGRCLRTGCHRPKRPGDELGLCRLHHAQLITGTIGHDYDPTSRETEISEAQALLEMVGDELFGADTTPSVRKLADRLDISKDLVHHTRRGTWTHIRSISWEALQDAAANVLFEQRRARRRENYRRTKRKQRAAQRRSTPTPQPAAA